MWHDFCEDHLAGHLRRNSRFPLSSRQRGMWSQESYVVMRLLRRVRSSRVDARHCMATQPISNKAMFIRQLRGSKIAPIVSARANKECQEVTTGDGCQP